MLAFTLCVQSSDEHHLLNSFGHRLGRFLEAAQNVFVVAVFIGQKRGRCTNACTDERMTPVDCELGSSCVCTFTFCLLRSVLSLIPTQSPTQSHNGP